jgi:hypothetical protein
MVAATLTMLTTATGAALASTNGVHAHAVTQSPQLGTDGTSTTPVPVDTSGVAGNDTASPSQCGSFSICMWKNAGFPNAPTWSADFFNEPSNTWLPVGASVNNAASSIDNTRDVATEVAQFRDGTGFQACIPPHTSYANLAHDDWPGTTTRMNDSITSYGFRTSTPAACHT